MSNFKEYLITDTVNGSIDIESIESAIVSNMEIALVNVLIAGDKVVFVFDSDITPIEEDKLDNIVHNHIGNLVTYYENIVSASIDFFNKMMINCAAKNVLQGITQAGKTKEVADYFTEVIRYGQSGSLFEVINELDKKILEGVPIELSPFVTEEKLIYLKTQAANFLGV